MRNNKFFLVIIIGSAIVGGCIYFGLKNDIQKQGSEVFIAPKSASLPVSQGPISTLKAGAIAGNCGAEDKIIVTKVIDGDTVVVSGGYHVRLLGIDADERGYPCYEAAKVGLERIVLGKQVVLEEDTTDVDQYGRCLRYLFVGSTNLNMQLVKAGLAVARFYAPDIKYKDEISDAEKYAQAGKIGCKWYGN